MIIAPYKDNYILAIAESLGSDFAKLAAMPGYFRWQERNAIIRTTGANIEYILNTWPKAQWIGGTEKIKQQYLCHKAEATATIQSKHSNTSDVCCCAGGGGDDDSFVFKRMPMTHQRKAFLLSRDKVAFGLFMEQGTGKTKVILDTAQWLWEQKLIDLLLVVAWPNGVHRNWIDYEIPADVRVPYIAEYWSSNHKAKHRQRALLKFLQTASSAQLKIFCFNVEAFTSTSAQEYIIKLLKQHKTLFVIDQSASIKNPQAKRTKFLIKCSKLAPYRRVLDGQPVAEGASELFSQFKFLDPWIIGHDTWTGFKNEFCKIGFFNEIVGYRNLDELRRRIDGYCFRVREVDCLDLPPRIYKMWSFRLDETEQKIFDDLKIKDIAEFSRSSSRSLDDDEIDNISTIEEHNALVKNMRLQQISSGWWPIDKPHRTICNVPSRQTALLNLINEIGNEKALIFARFRADLDLLQASLGKRAVSYHGGVSDDDRRIAIKRFMQDDDVLYFLGQPRSAGLGHTLTAAKHVIFYSNDHSLRLREECEKRAHRQGQQHRLHIWDLIAKNTQDINIVRAFRAKKELANEILQDPDNFFLHYNSNNENT